MLSLFTPFFVTLVHLVVAPTAAGSPRDARLEATALGPAAGTLAASVLVDADAIADFVVDAHAVTFEVEQAGERHELRVELDGRGAVVGASVWWLGAAEGLHRYDLVEVMPILEQAGRLDTIAVIDDVLWIGAGGVVRAVTAEYDFDAEEEAWDDEPSWRDDDVDAVAWDDHDDGGGC